MKEFDIRKVLIARLRQIAPDIPTESIDTKADLRDEYDIDSMDFLTLITGLGKDLSLPMPEADYDQMRSFDTLLTYLKTHAKV